MLHLLRLRRVLLILLLSDTDNFRRWCPVLDLRLDHEHPYSECPGSASSPDSAVVPVVPTVLYKNRFVLSRSSSFALQPLFSSFHCISLFASRLATCSSNSIVSISFRAFNSRSSKVIEEKWLLKSEETSCEGSLSHFSCRTGPL